VVDCAKLSVDHSGRTIGEEGWLINEAFQNLSSEKQERILNAAMAEFAERGYKHASTNKIVEAAEIGKGMLFYYFKNKLELYNYLLEYSMDCLGSYIDKWDETELNGDFIEKLRLGSKIKLEAYLKYPRVFDFTTRLYYNKDEASISDEAKIRYEGILAKQYNVMQSLYANVDTAKLRDDISAEKMVKYIRWLIDGYSVELSGELLSKFHGVIFSDLDLEPYWAEFDEILDDLKSIFYKDQEE